MFRLSHAISVVILLVLVSSAFAQSFETVIGTAQTALNGYDGCVGPDGTLYLAWTDYYDIRLSTSTDGGTTWNLTDMNTPHDGKLVVRQVCVDRQGNVFIFCQWNSRYPGSTNVYGSEFAFNFYCVTNVTGVWTEELVINYTTYSSGYSTSNNTAMPFDVYCDPNDNIRLFLYTYGWWSYGGTIHEKVRSAGAAGTWGAIQNVSHIQAGVDDQTRYFESMIAFPEGGVLVAANNPANKYCYYLNRPLAGPWGGRTTFANSNDYRTSHGGSMNLDVDEEGHVYCVYVDPISTLNFVKDWGEPEVVEVLTNPNYRMLYSSVEANADGEAVVYYRIYDEVQRTYISYDSVKTRDKAGNWSESFHFSDFLDMTDEVGIGVRFDMYHGGSFESPTLWYGTAAMSYPMPIFFLRMGEGDAGPPPDFEMNWMNPGLVVGPGEIPKIEMSVKPKNGFNQEVAFDIREATEYRFAFSPTSATPPANVALLLEKPSIDGPTSTIHNLTVDATSADGETVHQLPVSYEVVRPSENLASLTLTAHRNRIRLGDITFLKARLLPAFRDQPITLKIKYLDDPEMQEQTIPLTSDKKGAVSTFFAPSKLGVYEIRASWPGTGSWIARDSNAIQVELIARESQASIRIAGSYDIREGNDLDFICRVSPAPVSESATAEVYVEYGIVDDVPSVTESIIVPIGTGEYSGSVTLKESGLMRIRCQWPGEPSQTEGSESPFIMLYVLPEPVLSVSAFDPINDPGACLLISGATSENLPGDTRDYLANLAYRVLNQRRFNGARTVYMNDKAEQDVDWDGVPDGVVDIVDSSASAVWQSMSQASALIDAASPLSVFVFADRANGTGLMMNDGSILDASELSAKISENFGDERDIRIIVEASTSGEFCEQLAKSNRTIICSAQTEQAAYFSSGLLSFSQLYLSNIQQGWSIEQSFKNATDYLTAALGFFGVQTPVLYPATDYDPAYLFHGISSDAEDLLAPDILGVFEPVVQEETREAHIFARVFDDTDVEQVQALIRRPGGSSFTVDMQESTLTDGLYETKLNQMVLNQVGLYEVTITATDPARNSAEPKVSEISVIDRRDINRDGHYDEQDLILLFVEMDNDLSYYDVAIDNTLDFRDILLWAAFWKR